jgi:ketosteroid isomerase-like protein
MSVRRGTGGNSATMSRTRSNLEEFYAAIDSNDFAGAVDFLTEDVDWIWGGVPQRGRAAVQKFLRGGSTSLANRKHRITAYTEGKDCAAAELAVTARHTGPLHLPTGPISASGKDLNVSACHFLHVAADGRFNVSHIFIDFVGLLAQVSPSTR